jgi:hypothetical protein
VRRQAHLHPTASVCLIAFLLLSNMNFSENENATVEFRWPWDRGNPFSCGDRGAMGD